MEKILFTAAESEELDCAIAAYNEIKQGNPRLNNIEVNFLLTGIGATSTTYRVTHEVTTARAKNNPYTLLVNIGIAGSYDMKRFPIGSTAIIEREYFGDLGFETHKGFETLFEYLCSDPNEFPFHEGALCNIPNEDSSIYPFIRKIPKATGVTIQTVTGDMEKVEKLKAKFKPDIESMEGAHFFYVALMEKIPFFELRSVSNRVGERDKGNWDIPLALNALKERCSEFFKTFI